MKQIIFCASLIVTAAVGPMANGQESAYVSEVIIPVVVASPKKGEADSILTAEEKQRLVQLKRRKQDLRMAQLSEERESRRRRAEANNMEEVRRNEGIQTFLTEEKSAEHEAVIRGASILRDALASHELRVQARHDRARSAVDHAGNDTRAIQEEFSKDFQQSLDAQREFLNQMQMKALEFAATAGVGPVGGAAIETVGRGAGSAKTSPAIGPSQRDVSSYAPQLVSNEAKIHEHHARSLSQESCRPKLDPTPSLDSRVLSLFGFGDESCCGASRRCEELSPLCFKPGSQEDVCRQHDLDLKGLSAWDAKNPGTFRAHSKGANQSTSWPVQTGLDYMRLRSMKPATVDTWYKMGLPLYPVEPNLAPEG